MSESYPFDSDDDIEIRELSIESIDDMGTDRVTVGELAGLHESWKFGHVLVDEAQELTPMQWRMIMRRTRRSSITIMGDLAQCTQRDVNSWDDLLPDSLANVDERGLTINYRSPREINELANRLLGAFAPGVAPSRSIRSSGEAPESRRVDDPTAAASIAVDELLDSVDGIVAVIGVDAGRAASTLVDDRVRWLEPAEAKGLEFDGVVVLEPAEILALDGGPGHLYVALTRATRRLIMVHAEPLPAVLGL